MKRLWSAVLSFCLAAACGHPTELEAAEVRQAREALGTVTVEVGPGDGHLTVTWPDVSGELGYRIFSTQSTQPTALLAEPSSWRLAGTTEANDTSFTHLTFNKTAYIVCADFEDQNGTVDPLQCSAPTARFEPSGLPVIADINELGANNIGTRHIGVTWKESFSTTRSRISISPQGSGQSAVENDPDESFLFSGLQPNTSYRITGCVASDDQITLGEETCKTIVVSTFIELAQPGSLRSLSVDAADPSPRSRTIRFTHDNQGAAAVSSYFVRLFDAGANDFREEKRVLSRGTGLQSYSVTFDGLEPYGDYEAWVIPANTSGPGPASGIFFTTPIELLPETVALSGNSAMLLFDADAPGDYAIEQNGVVTDTLRISTPGAQRIVFDNLSTSKTLRVKWRYGTLNTVSPAVTASRGPSGAPEVRSGFLGPQFPFGDLTPMRISATFQPTVASLTGKYVLQGTMLTGGTRTLATLGPSAFSTSSRYTMSDTESLVVTSARVCREVTSKLGTTYHCSASLAFATDGLIRLH